jgi:regulator of protease activity HflC (stomatin/prohibitin superfamily)
MMKYLKLLVLGLFISALAACGRIDTGHTGVRTHWDKTVDSSVVHPGPYLAVTDSVQQYVTNEVTFEIKDLTPQTLDKSYLKDLDFSYTYKVTSNDLPALVTDFKNRTAVYGEDYYPMGLYVDTQIRAAAFTAAGKFNAMDANQHRADIEKDIIDIVSKKFKEEKLDGIINVSQVTVRNIEVDPKLQEAVVRQLNAQTDNKTKDIEIDTAKKETKRIEALAEAGASANNTGYIALLNAQSNAKIAEGIAAGRVNTIVIPSDFKGMVNVPAR